MTTAEASPAPGRIRGYDLARSLALLGMFVVQFGLVMARDVSWVGRRRFRHGPLEWAPRKVAG